MRHHQCLAPGIVSLTALLLASAGIASTPRSDAMPPIDHIVAERVTLAVPGDAEARLTVVDDAGIGLFGPNRGLPIDALRQTRSVRDLDVLVKLKLVHFVPRKPLKLGGAAAALASVAAAVISTDVDLRNASQQPFYYPPSTVDVTPVDASEDREAAAQLAGLLSADGCGARTIALLRRIAIATDKGKRTAAAVDARALLKRLGGSAYFPTDGCAEPEVEPDYVRIVASAS